jgi:hypothetical protein
MVRSSLLLVSSSHFLTWDHKAGFWRINAASRPHDLQDIREVGEEVSKNNSSAGRSLIGPPIRSLKFLKNPKAPDKNSLFPLNSSVIVFNFAFVGASITRNSENILK